MLRPAIGVCGVVGCLLSLGGLSYAAEIALTDAAIVAGKLVVTGTAPAGTRLRLEGRADAGFNSAANSDGRFSFAVVYHPGDCIVSVSGSAPGRQVNGLVANCGRDRLTPRGAWQASATYSPGDLVSFAGSNWRARRVNQGAQPVSGADWEVYAAGIVPDNKEASLDIAPTGAAGGDLAGTYPNPTIRNLVVTTAKIATNAITTSRIALGAITTNRIAANAVTTAQLANGAATNGKLATASVTAEKVADGSIGAAEIASDAVTAAEVAGDAVGSSEIADGAVGSGEIADGAIASVDIADGSITGAKIADGTITRDDLAPNSVSSEQIVNGSIQTVDLGVGSVRSGAVADFSLTNQDIGVLFAEVEADGRLLNSSGGVASSQGSPDDGVYEVDFGVDVRSCSYLADATLGIGPTFGFALPKRSVGNANAVTVQTAQVSGVQADKPFKLIVVC